MRLPDRVVLVTGSTKGIGRGIARALAREGAKVVVSGRDAAQGESVAGEIAAQGGEAAFLKADIADPRACRELVDRTVERFGRLDGLVNNAGVFPHIPLMDITPEVYDTVMDIDARGAFFCVQRALHYMIGQGGGSIVNIGSTHWDVGGETLPVYSMAKGALHTLTQHVAYHFGRYGVRSNWITVGWVLSEGEEGRLAEEGKSPEDIARMARDRIPLGRFQTAQDMAGACIYLLSDEAAQVTAADIAVHGGFRPL